MIMDARPGSGPSGPASPSSKPTILRAERVKKKALAQGADAVGIARAGPVDARELFMSWLGNGYEGDMEYMRKYGDIRYDPEALIKGAKSVIVVGLNYNPREEDRKDQVEGHYKVAKYAWGEDYHRVLRRLLRRLRAELVQDVPGLRGRICVDTAPFPDKYWAVRAGLGWQGKHTNLVSREFGSWLLLGSLVITQTVDEYDAPHTDFCGSCTACLSACPTAAFPKPYVLDATRCISYWTIESKSSKLPEDIAANMNGWMFGCDICLDVCPWNKFETPHHTAEFERSDAVSSFEDGHVEALSESEFKQITSGTPLGRPGHAGIVRNLRALKNADARADTVRDSRETESN